MDPELASEMVKLLAQELKAVRAQLRQAETRTSTTPSTGGPSNRLAHEGALIAENDTLKVDNAALQERVARLQDELRHVSSIKSEDSAQMPMFHSSDEFARLLAENEDLIREKEEASQDQEKLSVLQEKYRRTKAKVREYNEILNELRVALSNCTEELEQSRRTVASEIDFRDFLNDSPYVSVEGQLELSSIPPYNHCRKLHKDVMDLCNGPYFINYNEVIWSASGIALGLVIKPTFQYNPKIQGGAWTKFEVDFEIGKQMDVCSLSGKTARYLGTYERVETQSEMVVAPETLRHLDREKLNFVSKRTTLFPDLVPPSQTQMIQNMYKQGVIKLQCFGIRCVAFNQTFAEKLQTSTSSVQRNHPDNIPTSAITNGNNRKRKQDPKSIAHSNRNKKRYGSFTDELNKTL